MSIVGGEAQDKENNEVPRQNVYLDAAPPAIIAGNQADRFDPGWSAQPAHFSQSRQPEFENYGGNINPDDIAIGQ